MKEANADILCTHGGDMLAYLYDEMTAVDRDSFELHLADCGACIDDFAELSQSRYPVFEWKQLEFDPLQTPRIVIPVEEAKVSLLDKLRASFVFRPSFAFGGVAAVALFGSLAAFVLLGGSDTDGTIAQADQPAPPAAVSVAPLPIESEDIPYATDDPVRVESPTVVKTSVQPAKPTRAVKPKTAPAQKRSQPLPTLSNSDEIEDDSLRLADIFDEIDTSDS
jgi:anti-sigma factor RsiW